jgi:uncharacterized Zn finger protein
MRCSCPDYAGMCKHVAAVMYGVGNRLDSSPELLFVLRGVDHMELIEQAIPTAPARTKSKVATIATDDLAAIFDIEIADTPVATAVTETRKQPASKKVAKQASTKLAALVARADTKARVKPASKKVVKKTSAKKKKIAASREPT